MISELRTASCVICQRLQQRPYLKRVTITAWRVVVEQLLDGRRYGAFSWHNALEIEVWRYIEELDNVKKRKMWKSTEDCKIIPNTSIETITDCLYAHIFQASLPRIYRAVNN